MGISFPPAQSYAGKAGGIYRQAVLRRGNRAAAGICGAEAVARKAKRSGAAPGGFPGTGPAHDFQSFVCGEAGVFPQGVKCGQASGGVSKPGILQKAGHAPARPQYAPCIRLQYGLNPWAGACVQRAPICLFSRTSSERPPYPPPHPCLSTQPPPCSPRTGPFSPQSAGRSAPSTPPRGR